MEKRNDTDMISKSLKGMIPWNRSRQQLRPDHFSILALGTQKQSIPVIIYQWIKEKRSFKNKKLSTINWSINTSFIQAENMAKCIIMYLFCESLVISDLKLDRLNCFLILFHKPESEAAVQLSSILILCEEEDEGTDDQLAIMFSQCSWVPDNSSADWWGWQSRLPRQRQRLPQWGKNRPLPTMPLRLETLSIKPYCCHWWLVYCSLFMWITSSCTMHIPMTVTLFSPC